MHSNKICKECVLPSSFPGITYNADGICNHCNSSGEIENDFTKYESKFLELIERIDRKDGKYDALLCYSGGKDSSYTLYILKKKYNLKILSYTFDNGFLSANTLGNIKQITESLNVDNIVFSPNFHTLRALFKKSILKKDAYPPASLMRASSICTSCINLVKFTAYKLALEKHIPLLIFGWAPGQISEKSILVRLPHQFIMSMQNIFTGSFRNIFEEEHQNWFLSNKGDKEMNINAPYWVNPMLFNDYDESLIEKKLVQFGWKRPADTDLNSSNCLLNTLANYIHEKRYGYNPYSFELSCRVRDGNISRAEALKKISKQSSMEVLDYCMSKLQIDQQEIFNN